MWAIPAKFRLDVHDVGHVVSLSDQVVGDSSSHMSHSDNANFLLLRWGGEIPANNGRTSFNFRQRTTKHFCKLLKIVLETKGLYKIIVGVVLVSGVVAKWVLSEISSTNKTYFIFYSYHLSGQNYKKKPLKSQII